MKKRESNAAQTTGDTGAPSSAGRISVDRKRFQTIVANLDQPGIYRISNSSPQDSAGNGNVLLVRSGEPSQVVRVAPKNSVDVQAKAISVRAGDGGESEIATGWYELISG